EPVSEDLGPVRRARAATREDGARKGNPGFGEDLHMAAVLEHDPLQDRAQHVAFMVPAGKAEETATQMRPGPTAIKERVEEWVVRRGHRPSDQVIDKRKRIARVSAAIDQRAHVPFEIGTGGGAVLHIHELVRSEGRDHEHALVADRLPREDLVDGPASGYDGCFAFLRDT